MFYYKFFCQTIQCPNKEGGRIPPPSDVSPTKKHADVTRVKNGTYQKAVSIMGSLTNYSSLVWKMVAKLETTLQFQHNIGLMDKMIPTIDLHLTKK